MKQIELYGEALYKRAARSTGRVLRMVLIPAAITLGVAASTYAAFSFGRAYEAIGSNEGIELKILEQKIERSATIRDGKLYIYEKTEQKQVIPLEEAVKQKKQEKKQMVLEYL